ncbi:MAG: peroxiredoxin family protein [Deltaproteobacteria bacterium]|nr:peroxiredoxin family protein [Deltaproteobacteria bacterium]
MRDSGTAIRKFDVDYYMVSVDDPETNARFAAELSLDFPILSDPSRKTARAYGVLGETGHARRVTFYIDVDGIIRGIDQPVAVGSHGPDVARRLSELGFPRR